MIDKTLSESPGNELLVQGDELFNAIFKITYYGATEHSACNTTLAEIENTTHMPESHSQVLARLENLDMPQHKINVVVNNILLHHLDQVGRSIVFLAANSA